MGVCPLASTSGNKMIVLVGIGVAVVVVVGGGVVARSVVECYCIYTIIIVGVPQPRHSRFVDVECLLVSFSCVPPT